MTAQVLLVDGDDVSRPLIEAVLAQDGNRVRVVDQPAAFGAALREASFDLVLLGWGRSVAEAIHLLRLLRGQVSTPAILIGGRPAGDADGLDAALCLELGADDYLTRPVQPRELLARAHALLRRTRASAGTFGRIEAGDLVVDLEAREVRLAGRTVSLTALEFDLLAHLARHPRRAFTREQLLRDVWRQTWLGDPSAVTVLVRRLRQKIEDCPSRPGRLVTVYGVGYRLQPTLSARAASGALAAPAQGAAGAEPPLLSAV